jgi:hypothetical protein
MVRHRAIRPSVGTAAGGRDMSVSPPGGAFRYPGRGRGRALARVDRVLSRKMEGGPGLVVGRYELGDVLAHGGMATVHLGRLLGEAGFARPIAIKRLHPHLAKEPEFVAMLLDEARLTSRIRHANVVQMLDVVLHDGELLLVMEYVHGEALHRLIAGTIRQGEPVPLGVVIAVASDLLRGLDAAHSAADSQGEPLHIIHRDVSPQNVLVGKDGLARVLDFGIAKARDRIRTTMDGSLKGKAPYMAPEQLLGDPCDHRVDLHAASVVLWELLTCRRLFTGDTQAEIMRRVLTQPIAPPSEHVLDIPAALDALVLRGLAREPDERFASGREMADALEACAPIAGRGEVTRWVERIARDALADRAAALARIELVSPAHPGVATLMRPRDGGTGDTKVAPQTKGRRGWVLGIVLVLAASIGAAVWALHRAPSPDGTETVFAEGPSGGALPELPPVATAGPVPRPVITAAPDPTPPETAPAVAGADETFKGELTELGNDASYRFETPRMTMGVTRIVGFKVKSFISAESMLVSSCWSRAVNATGKAAHGDVTARIDLAPGARTRTTLLRTTGDAGTLLGACLSQQNQQHFTDFGSKAGVEFHFHVERDPHPHNPADDFGGASSASPGSF